MSCSVYLFIIIFMLNVQYHKFSITITERNSSTSSTTSYFILRDVIFNPKPKLLNIRSNIGISKLKEELIENTTEPTKPKTKVLGSNELYDSESLESTKNKRIRDKRSRRQRPRSNIRTKLPRGLTKLKENYTVDVYNSSREARQILKANILELFDIKPTTNSDNIENDPYMLNDIEPYDTSDAYSKKKLMSIVRTDDEKAVIESPELPPKKRKRTEVLNDIEDNFGVDYYSDQKHAHGLKVTDSNEDFAIIGASLIEPKAHEQTQPAEATANIYYEDTSDCKQDTWQTIALRHMQGAQTGRTRKTWRFNLKKQSLRTTDVALVQRLLRGYNEQHTTYAEQTIFRKPSRRKSKKLKISADGSVQYDTNYADNNDENVVKVTEIKEYDTILEPVPPPEIEIHTLPMPTAVIYAKYKETGDASLLRAKSPTPTTTYTEKVWVYSFKTYATRPYGAITNTYILTDENHYVSTTTELTVADTSSPEPTVFTYEEKKTYKTKEPEPPEPDYKKKAKGSKGSGNDWLYDANDPDQIAYEMKVTEEDEENSEVRVFARSMQHTHFQRRWTYGETTKQLIQPAVRNSAVSLHSVRLGIDYLKKLAKFTTDSTIKSIVINLEENVVETVGALVTKKSSTIEDYDKLMESCNINEENTSPADINVNWLEEYSLDSTVPTKMTQVMHFKEYLMSNDAKFTDKKTSLNQKLK